MLNMRRYVRNHLIVLLGCAGTGRATHLERLSERFHYMPVIPGILIAEANLNPSSPHHNLIASCMQDNTPIPGFIICDLILSYIENSSCKKLIFDDFPNCEDHLNSFLEFIAPRVEAFKVVSLHCPSTVCVQRIMGDKRNSLEELAKREDLERKFSSYWKNMDPVLEYCKKHDVLWQIDAMRSSEDVFEELRVGFANFA